MVGDDSIDEYMDNLKKDKNRDADGNLFRHVGGKRLKKMKVAVRKKRKKADGSGYESYDSYEEVEVTDSEYEEDEPEYIEVEEIDKDGNVIKVKKKNPNFGKKKPKKNQKRYITKDGRIVTEF